MHRTIPENRTSAPSQSHSLSGCDTSQIDSVFRSTGVYVEVGEVGGAVYLDGDVIDNQMAYWSYEAGVLTYWPAPERTFVPHSAADASRIASMEGRHPNSRVRPAPDPVVGAGSGVTPGGVS